MAAAAPASTDLLAGRIDLGFLPASAAAHIQLARCGALAIANETRSEACRSSHHGGAGFADFDLSTWYGISAPARHAAPDRGQACRRDRAGDESAGDQDKLTKAGVELFHKGPRNMRPMSSRTPAHAPLIDARGCGRN